MKKIYFLSFLFAFSALPAFSQMGYWTPRANFPSGGRSAVSGFNVGSAAFFACGIDSAGYKRSTWMYNPLNDSWVQLQSLGGTTGAGLSRDVAMSFVVGNDAYVVGGQGSIAYFNDTWKYDAFNDVWTQVQTFPGGGRRSGVGFTVNGKGYVALGQASTGLKNDCWEYNATSNTWTQKANFTGTARRLAVAFVIGNIAYVGTGDDGVFKNDFYAFDPAANTWTARAAFGGTARYAAVAFTLNGKGYVGFGYDNTLSNRKDFWEYNATTNTWVQMANFPGTARANAVAISCPNNRAYMGTGYDSLYRDDWWEFDPLSNGMNEQLAENQVSIFPNPVVTSATLQLETDLVNANEKITVVIFDVQGKEVKRIVSTGTNAIVIDRDGMEAGLYLVQVSTEAHGAIVKRMMVR